MLGFSIVSWIMVGALAGWLGSTILKTHATTGVLVNVIAGGVGGLFGGYLLFFLGADVRGARLILSFLTCLLGAIVLLFLVTQVSQDRRPHSPEHTPIAERPLI